MRAKPSKLSFFIVYLILFFPIVAAHVPHDDTVFPKRTPLTQYCYSGKPLSDFLTDEAKESCAALSYYTDDAVKDIILSLAYPVYDSPSHPFVYEWNKKLEFDEPPDGFAFKNGNLFIKRAWIAVVAIMPSAWENGVLYARTAGMAEAGYSYYIDKTAEVDHGFPTAYNCHAPQTRTITGVTEDVKLKLNGKELIEEAANGRVTAYYPKPGESPPKGSLKFDAELSIDIAYTEKNCEIAWCYDKDIGYYPCGCDCDEKTHHDIVSSSHSLTAERLDFQPRVEYGMAKSNEAVFKLVSNGPLGAFKLNYKNQANYSISDYSYGVRWDYAPYNVLSMVATKREKPLETQLNLRSNTDLQGLPDGLQAIGSLVTLPGVTIDLDNCDALFYSHIDSINIVDFCAVKRGLLIQTKLEIENTDDIYDLSNIDERQIPIRLRLTDELGNPVDKQEVKVRFQNTEKKARTDSNGRTTITFDPTTGGLVAASFDIDFDKEFKYGQSAAFKFIRVIDNRVWFEMLYAGTFLAIWYFMFAFLRAYQRRIT